MGNNELNKSLSEDSLSPSVSVAVINFNGKKYLDEVFDNCIESILNNDYENFEVLIVDNGSTDGSVAHIKNKFGSNNKIRIIALEKNLGTEGAKNVGVKEGKGQYILLLNNDIFLKKETLSKMVNVLEKNSDIGILGCKLVTPEGEIQTEGEFLSNKISLLSIIHPKLLKRINNAKITKSKKSALNYVDYVIGAAFMFKKSLLMKLNLFDEYYFMYSGEVDIGHRVHKAGYKIACLNNYEIIHYGKLTSKHYSDWRRNLVSRNLLLFLKKNYSNIQLAYVLLLYVMRIPIHFFNSLFKFDELEWKTSLSYIKAFWYIRKPAIVPE
jgi:GT2 family glycosyltransferase